jgi:hypothetical protein
MAGEPCPRRRLIVNTSSPEAIRMLGVSVPQGIET